MRKFAINGVDLLASAGSYVSTEIDGLDDADRRVSATVFSGENGGFLSTNLYGLRPLTVTGVITGHGSVTSYSAARAALIAACRLQSDANGYPVLARIDITDDAGLTYVIYGAITSFKAPHKSLTSSEYIIQLTAPDPLIYGSASLTTGQFAHPVSTGVNTTLLTWPAVFANPTGGTGSIFNSGSSETWPILTLRGANTNPFIYLVETGQGFKLNYVTTNPADVIVIDMRAKLITLNGTTSLISAKDDTSDWFMAPVGTSTWKLTTSSSSDTGTLEVTAHPAYASL